MKDLEVRMSHLGKHSLCQCKDGLTLKKSSAHFSLHRPEERLLSQTAACRKHQTATDKGLGNNKRHTHKKKAKKKEKSSV